MTMLDVRKRLIHFILPAFCFPVFVVYSSCNPKVIIDDERPKLETVIHGIAPMNTSGASVEARVFESDSAIGVPVKTDDMGRYTLRLRSATGDISVRACGGSYVDPATGLNIDNRGECLHALATDVELCESRELDVVPFSEIVHSYARSKGVLDAILLRSKIDEWLGSNDKTTRSAAFFSPNTHLEYDSGIFNQKSVSYLIMGGLSQLSYNIGPRFGKSHSESPSMMMLVQILSKDISDGRIDGYADGNPLCFPSGSKVPADLLRHDLAHSILLFVNSERNKSGVDFKQAEHVVRNISENSLPALGIAGVPFDQEPPSIKIDGIAGGGVVSSIISLSCRSTDASGVQYVHLFISDPNRNVVFENTMRKMRSESERDFRVELNVSSAQLQSGQFNASCVSEDIWGNRGQENILFFVNHGEIGPEVMIIPEGQGEDVLVSGGRTIQCTTDDPYVTEMQAVIQGPDETVELETVMNSGVASYQWDTSDNIDGFYNVSCRAWTVGHRSPRMSSKTVRVRNNSRGNIRGNLFIGSPLSNMQISAFKFSGGNKGDMLGGPVEIENQTGEYVLALSNEYAGPVIVEASVIPSKACPEVESVCFMNHVQQLKRTFSLSTIIPDYQPGRDIDSVSLNIATTIVAELVARNMRLTDEHDLTGTIDDAFMEIGRLVSPLSPIDLRETTVPMLNQSLEGVTEDRLALGLFHGGLMAIDKKGASECSSVRDYMNVDDVCQRIKMHISSASLRDGNDGSPLRTVLSPGGASLFRYELAYATHKWIGSPGNRSGLLNRTNISSDHILNSGWLFGVSSNDLSIFGDEHTPPFDSDGPVLTVSCYDRQGNRRDCSGTFRGRVRVRVLAEDAVGVRSTDVYVDGRLVNPDMSDGANLNEYVVETEEQFRGNKLITVRSVDRHDNATEKSIDISFDSSAVVFIDPVTEYRVSRYGEYIISLNASKDIEQVVVSGFKLDRENRGIESYRIFPGVQRDVSIPLCLDLGDGPYRFDILCMDSLGNEGTVSVVVNVDTRTPDFDAVPVPITNHMQGRQVSLSFGEHWSLYINDIDWDPYRWGLYVKRWPSWKLYSLKDGRRTEEPSLDPVKFQYRYSMSDHGVRRIGSWVPVYSGYEEGAPPVLSANYATLLESLHGTSVENIGSDENVIYHASDDAVHKIEIRMTDSYGHIVEKSSEFNLFIQPPSISARLVVSRDKNDSKADFIRTHTLVGSNSNVKIVFEWPGILRNNDNTEQNGKSLLPELGRARVNMNNLQVFWRILHDTHGNGWRANVYRMFQFLNFGNQEGAVVIPRGTSEFFLKTVGIENENEGRSFFDFLGHGDISIERRMFSSPLDYDLTGKKVGDLRHGSLPWKWKIEAKSTASDRRNIQVDGDIAMHIDFEEW